jgi:hypothetical protein
MRTTLEAIPAGDAGTDTTLRRMAAMVRRDALNSTVRGVALGIVRRCPDQGAGATACQLRALRKFLVRHVRFVRDPVHAELVHAPRILAQQLVATGSTSGDCDDVATLGAALGRAVGFDARFVVLGFFDAGAPWSHVYAELRDPQTGAWQQMDVTREYGRLPATRVGTFPV